MIRRNSRSTPTDKKAKFGDLKRPYQAHREEHTSVPGTVCHRVLAALLAFDPFSRSLRWGALLYAAIGVIFSIYFMYIQFTFIHAFCIYCLISAVLTFLLFIAARSHFRAARVSRGPTRSQ
jgi:uncharacterized membrane protein